MILVTVNRRLTLVALPGGAIEAFVAIIPGWLEASHQKSIRYFRYNADI
jgi:hypothetical protein